VQLEPVGESVDLGSLPINVVVAPEGDKAVVVLSGWREQGIQVVGLKTRKVTQTLLQDGAFYGAAFSPDRHQLFVSEVSPNGKFVYIAENVGDRLAVVNAVTGEVVQRFTTGS
jgi:DNA-binding beta-propeller fold protein YncE